MKWVENFLFSFGDTGSFFSIILVKGLTGLVAGVSIALPYVFLFYLLFGLLEDIGLLSRFIFNAESFLSKLGLPGKSFIPLMLGLGCTTSAIKATRVLKSTKKNYKLFHYLLLSPALQEWRFILELLPYRKPLIKNIFAKSWVKMKDFVYIVVSLLAVGGTTYLYKDGPCLEMSNWCSRS